MYHLNFHLFHLALLVAFTYAAPTVTLDKGVFVGVTNASTQTNKFLGIPYALPPNGTLRFNLPVPNIPYSGTYDATRFGFSCVGQESTPTLPTTIPEFVEDIIKEIFSSSRPESEDCLTVNVIQPVGIPPGKKLPVVAWIFGGGFEEGASNEYPGALVVEQSVKLNQPVIYVSMNYRLSAYGFLASSQVQAAGVGNLGLQDQRLALRWIQKYISAFGGDPNRVTIWGESAGAISVALHLVANNGNNEGLFHGAFMQSGSPIPVGNITHGQRYYDTLVADTGCSGAPDTLKCLRTVPFEQLKAAVNKAPGIFSYQSLNLAWLPRVDGKFLTDTPQKLVLAGKVAKVPLVTGDCDDEGTLFTLQLGNITTDQQVYDYVSSNYMPQASSAEVAKLLSLYPQDPAQGSPYGTGSKNTQRGPQFKRLASLQGDLVFQAPRRFFLQQISGKQPVWAYLSKRLKYLPEIGSVHGSDLLDSYGILMLRAELLNHLIYFVNKGDPNGGVLLRWPTYSVSAPSLLTLNEDLLNRVNITQDDYRQQAIEYLTTLSRAYPL